MASPIVLHQYKYAQTWSIASVITLFNLTIVLCLWLGSQSALISFFLKFYFQIQIILQAKQSSKEAHQVNVLPSGAQNLLLSPVSDTHVSTLTAIAVAFLFFLYLTAPYLDPPSIHHRLPVQAVIMYNTSHMQTDYPKMPHYSH